MANLIKLIAIEEQFLSAQKNQFKKSYIRTVQILSTHAGSPIGLGSGFVGGFLLGLYRRSCPDKKSDDTNKDEQRKTHLLSNQALWVFLTTALTQYLQNKNAQQNETTS